MLLGRNAFAVSLARATLNAALRRPFAVYACRQAATTAWPKLANWPRRTIVKGTQTPARQYTTAGDRRTTDASNTDGGAQQSVFQRFKTVAKKYWYIVLPVHLVTSTVWLGAFYFIASSGVDVPALLAGLGFPEWVVDKVRDGGSWKSHAVITYGLYKIFTPLRYMVTLGGTGLAIRQLRRLGYAVGRPKKP